MLKTFICILYFGGIFASNAFAQSPIEGQIDDPVFMIFPKSSLGSVENKNSINFDFSTDRKRCRAYYGNNYYAGCRPRLSLAGKRAGAGVTIYPPIKGEWRWSNNYRLTFTPLEHWLADQTYVVNIDFDGLNVPERVMFEDRDRTGVLSIKSSPLNVKITGMRYMQDPDDPSRKLVSAHFSMNYPVIRETLDTRIHLTLEEKDGNKLSVTGTSLPYDLQFQPDGLSANLSVPITKLPDHDRYLKLRITPGVRPEFGGEISGRVFKERARVPSLASYLAFRDSSAVIVRQENGTPQQILSLVTNVKAQPEDLLGKVKLYLLPFDHPVMGRDQNGAGNTPYRWRAANEVTPAILEKAEELSLDAMPSGIEYATQFGFGFKAPAGRYLYVSVDQGLKAFGGYTLENGYDNILPVPAYPHDIKIMQDGSILTLSGAQKLSLHARGTDQLQVEVAQILPEALGHFVSQTKGDIRNPSFKHWAFDKNDIARLDTKDVTMAYVSPYDSQYASFDFSPYLKNKRKGIFLLSIQGFKDNQSVGSLTQRFVLVTDMGLLVKHNADQSRDIFLSSFVNGRPIGTARISVLGKNGLQVFAGQTDKDGHISLPDFSGYTKDRQPVAIVAQKGDDYAFIPYNRYDRMLNTSRFDVGGTRIAAKGLNAFLFSDRGIYRPGETAHVGMIVKNADWQALPPVLPLKAVITDPRGRIVREKLINFSAPGLEDIALETEGSWPTGVYFVNLYISNDGKSGSLLGSTSLRVEEFMPDRLKIKTAFLQHDKEIEVQDGWLKPDDLRASVVLSNLYGTPASNRRIKAKVHLGPVRLAFDAYPDYRFYDPYAAKPRRIQYDLPSTKTDKDGRVDIALNLERQDKATYSLNLEMTGYEAGRGKGVTAYRTALVSPMDYVVGYHSDANLGYLSKDKNYSVEVKALDALLSSVAAKDLALILLRKSYVSTLVKRSNGSYVYESVPKEDVVETINFEIDENGTSLSLPTNDLGDFIYRVETKDHLIVADIPFSVAGEGASKGQANREAVLRVKTNKADYSAGEDITLNISAPYIGAGLITLESDHVLAYKWFRTETTETVQSIAVPADFSGKGYVNVAFVRDINSREIYLSPLSNAIVPFTANTDNRRVSIDLNVPETVTPGKDFQIRYKGHKKGKAIIFAVDEGVLQVARYKTPDPVHYFLLNRALQVQTSQMLDLLMPEYALIKELSAHGGGAALEGAVFGKHLNPFKRKVLAPAVYWSGVVDLDTQERTLHFTPPSHFNGQLRVMAIAVGQGSVGHGATEVTVRSDIVITPNIPIFLAPDDVVEASVTIANGLEGSGDDAVISVRLEPSEGLSVIHSPSDTITIAEGTEQSVTFTIKATDTLGKAHLIVHANIADVANNAEATLSIRPPVAKETTMTSGYAKDGTATLTLTRRLYPDFAEKSLSVSPLPTAYIHGLVRYLDAFPYGCTEQITSRIYPQLSLMNFPAFAVSQDDMMHNVDRVVSTLRRRQTHDGGFSLWNGGYEADDFVSIYAMDFLLQAQNTSFPVPTDLIRRGQRYLRNWVNTDIKSMKDARNKAYAIYVLTRSGMVTTNEILHWLKYFGKKKQDHWKTDLSAIYIAASYDMMQQNKLARTTMDGFEKGLFADEISHKNVNGDNPYYSPFVKYAQYISILSRHFPERFKGLNRDIVFKLVDFIQHGHYNTLSSSYAIQALSDYAALQGRVLRDSPIVVKAGTHSLPLSGEGVLQSVLPLDVSTFSITDGGQPLFYAVTETGYSRDVADVPVAEGLEIGRTYQMADGKQVDGSVNIDDIVHATIKVRAHNDRRIENVAIVDLLPGGFALEPENGPNGSTLFPDFVERREDRVIIFTDISSYEQVFHYRLRAISKGEFHVPPPYAEAMYDLTKKAKGRSGKIVVRDEAQ